MLLKLTKEETALLLNFQHHKLLLLVASFGVNSHFVMLYEIVRFASDDKVIIILVGSFSAFVLYSPASVIGSLETKLKS